MESLMREAALRAGAASQVLARVSSREKDRFLLALADALVDETDLLLGENAKDLAEARAKGISGAMLDRLTLKPATVTAMAQGVREVAALPDPVGKILSMWRRPNGLLVGRMRIPLGVIGIIYEARPNVTIDAAALCLKSGNAVILRGGSEAINSNVALGRILQKCLRGSEIPEAAAQVIETTDRRAVTEMLQLDEHIDLIIPRGGEELIRAVVNASKIPVIKHYKGVCHIFVDASADPAMAEAICMNAKIQRPAVCNAMETLLVHEEIAPRFLPSLTESYREAGVVLRGCPQARAIVGTMEEATEDDWYREYLDLTLAVRVVPDLDEAIRHIARYGSLHTESIITSDYGNAQRFLTEVNSSTVAVNASTRFSDGFELGLGAEIGISTTKLHAFGPMGLEELTTAKFIIYGSGQIRT